MENFSIFGWELGAYLTPAHVALLLRVVTLIVIGFPVVYLLDKWTRAAIKKRYSAQRAMIAGKLVFYTGAAIIFVSVLYELGFSLAPLLGTAGIVGIALGFASQTSVSNIISGLFLIAEQPFVVGDLITVGGTTGQVLSVDILSVKLRTFQNQFVRIPNETLIKSEVANITHFPIRRLDVNVSVAYKEDIARVQDVLLDVAHHNPVALQEPEPLIIFSGFGDSSIDLIFAIWVVKGEYLKLKNSIQAEIKQRFDQEGIEIPFPHLSFYAGSASKPLPVELVAADPASEI